jgi:hypothetical protein
MQGQFLIGTETLHAIKRRVHMIGEALGLLSAGVVTALWAAFRVQGGCGAPERFGGLIE